MKLVIMNSSYRKHGNTEIIVKLLKEQLTKEVRNLGETVEIEEISLSELRIETCRGCRACFNISEQSCPLKDEVLPLYDKLKQADGIILASPVYVEDINGSMKNWIDRMAFNCHRPFLCGKPVMLFVTTGRAASNHAIRTMGSAIGSWGGVISGTSIYRMGELMSADAAKRRYGEKVRRQSILLLQSIKKSKPSIYSLIAFAIQQMVWQQEEYNNTADYRYWKEQGWLEKKCYYYRKDLRYGVRIRLVRLLGLLAGRYYIRT